MFEMWLWLVGVGFAALVVLDLAGRLRQPRSGPTVLPDWRPGETPHYMGKLRSGQVD